MLDSEAIAKNGKSSSEPTSVKDCDDVKVYSNVIPLRRDKHGNPLPRRHIFLRPLVTLDPKALMETGEAFLRSTEAGGRHLPWLKAKNALAADRNVQSARRAIQAKIASDNARLEGKIKQIEPELEAAKTRETAAKVAAVAALEGIPIAFASESPTLDFAPNEPYTLEELAGIHGLPQPESAGWWEKKGYKILSAVGGGIVFGLSFGLLTEKIQLLRLAREWPMILVFALIGITIMTIIEGIFPWLGKSVGRSFYRRGITTPWMSWVSFVLILMFLLGLAAAIILIESRVEQLGIFKGIAASNSLHGIHILQSDLVWVSLMLVVPVVSCYTIVGVAEGERQANLVHLKGLLAKMRADLRVTPIFANAAKLHQQMRFHSQERIRLETEINELKNGLRYELTQEEIERLEDMEMDATAHSWDTEDLFLREAGTLFRPGAKRIGVVKRRPFWWIRRLWLP